MASKKHFRQMSNTEINYLLSKARSVLAVNVTGYCLERLKQRKASVGDIMHVLQTGYLVEYHKKDTDNRILLRGTKRFGNDVLCVVLSLNSNKIITAYFNRYDDHHYTLDESAYNKHINILKEMKVA
jgi:hypothetical protein